MAPKGVIKLSTYQALTNLAKSRLETIKIRIEDLENKQTLSATDIKTLLKYMTEVNAKKLDFENNLSKILESEEIDLASLAADVDTINDLYAELASRIESVLPEDHSNSFNDSLQNVPTTCTVQTVKLPKIQLKSFNGNPNNWVSFINLFNTAVHQNSTLNAVTKMQYLLSSLENEPLDLIKSLNLNAANYLIAYQLLQDRYQNKRRLTTLHLNALLDLTSIKVGDVTALRHFVNLFFEHSQALKSLDCDITTESNPLLAAHLLRKLDQELRRKLEIYRTGQGCTIHSLPSVDEIIKFLNEECVQIEDASLHHPQSEPQAKTSHSIATKDISKNTVARLDKKTTSFHKSSFMTTQGPSSVTTNSANCSVCKQPGHKIYACAKFQSFSPIERYKLIKEHTRCISCLGSHHISVCKSKGTCKRCQKRHHTLLHFEKDDHSASNHSMSPASNEKPLVTASAQPVLQMNATPSCSTVLLGTALVHITAANGISHVFRALLDSGSMTNFISEHAAQLLQTSRVNSNHTIVGISNIASKTRGLTELNIANLSGKTIAKHQPFYILEKISNHLPQINLSPEILKRVKPYTLADPTFHISAPIDILLGSALFPILFTNTSHSLGKNMPYAIETQFGHVIMGSAPCDIGTSHSTSSHCMSFFATDDFNLHNSLQRFWLQEEAPKTTTLSTEELHCEQHFVDTHSRESDGRYVVRLPFKDNHPPLGSSLIPAERRFWSLENKFKLQPEFRELYSKFMCEYRDLGHMSKVDPADLSNEHCYLPHHGVLKSSSSTTKLRTVFDASCKTSSGLSLNDVLCTGQKLQTNICDILLYFRLYNFVFACDIRQMYRQIKVHPEDRRFQLVLWRDNPDQNIATFQLNTVTFGLNCSPFLAIRTLRQLADDEGATLPYAAEVLRNDSYVDDIISGADTLEAAQSLQKDLITLLRRGGFELRKWASNSAELLQHLPAEHLEVPVCLSDVQEPHFSILGIYWSPNSDNFSFKFNLKNESLSKRQILSVIARIYDPCGFLSPCTMVAKCFLQLLWTSGLNWDDPLPSHLASKWLSFVKELPTLSSLQIPRAFHMANANLIQLHGFSDASELGYAAVLYLRVQHPDNNVTTRLIIAKTRVAPLKRISLPRLELCAAHLLAKLMAHTMNLFKSKVDITNVYLWCDSTVVLTWLRTPSYKLKTFVANRVTITQDLIPSEHWHHISGKDNPADCASRGVTPSSLKSHPLWWSGPTWLSLPMAKWPKTDVDLIDFDNLEETKGVPLPIAVLTISPLAEWDILFKFSSWTTLLRVTAYLLRFIHNSQNKARQNDFLTVKELRSAETCIFKLIQATHFSDTITSLRQQKIAQKQIQRLNPFLDSDGLIRAGGRLRHSSLSKDAMHPILLPKKHHVINLLIDHYHIQNLHAGPQLTQALLSQKYWILSARSLIRSRIFKCIICFKNKPKPTVPLMGDLPKARVEPARPFLSTGMDYFGPFTIKMINLRAVRHIKVYLCIFVCMATKAVHIETVTDLTTEAFIAALTRFVSRRGICAELYSDCGTNFIGADNALKRLVDQNKDQISHFSTANAIHFHFNPPAAPHQGGLWERAVRSAKHHLRRVMGETVLTLMEFITLSSQVEAVLNSRPLTQLSTDPNDSTALTPGHFLIGAPLVAVPETSWVNTPLTRLRRWQLVQALHQHFWKRWQLEYLHTLQQRTKWTVPHRNLQVGDLVLIHAATPPLTWPLARITAVHPGADGTVRVVDLRTANGTFSRPATKVFPLPLED